MFLFQYGSNMLFERFAKRVRLKAAELGIPDKVATINPPTKAKLPGWCFDLGGHDGEREKLVCDVLETADDSEVVWGALHELDPELVICADGSRSVLDWLEGHKRKGDEPDVYRQTCVRVVSEGTTHHAWTYVCSLSARCCPDCAHRATRKYSKFVLDGAKELRLPAPYQAGLAEICDAATEAG